jgi:hypothetical protein
MLVIGISFTLGACDRAPSTKTVDTAGVVTQADSVDIPMDSTTPSGWMGDAGLFVILPSVDGGLATGSLLRPDANDRTVGDTTGLRASLGAGELELFARSGRVGSAKISIERAIPLEPGCTAWPVARLTAEGAPITSWTAAFAAGRISPITLDSIEGLPPRDSARLAMDLTRLASALPDDTVAAFRGLPFVVLRAWRSRGLDTDFVVATLARRLNQEDSPREERLVMVVDMKGTDAKKWSVAWHERASGREDELVVADPLLSFRTLPRGAAPDGPAGSAPAPGSAVHLLFARDDGVALAAAILRRDATGWHVQWESAIAGCG